MIYTQILKALHRHVQQAATNCTVHTQRHTHAVSLLVHAHRTVSSVSTGTLLRRAGVPVCVLPALSCFSGAQTRRGVCLTLSARNKSSPGDRDQSVSRYQGGSPKPSAAQKGKQDTLSSLRLSSDISRCNCIVGDFSHCCQTLLLGNIVTI